MIIDDNPKLKTISDLAKKLFDGISPDLQKEKDWMKEVVEKLDFMTNEKSNWAEKAKKSAMKSASHYRLEGYFFSECETGLNNRPSYYLFSLNGESILENYEEICHPKTVGNILAFKFGQRSRWCASLIDIYGNPLREYVNMSESDEVGNRVGSYVTSFAKVKKKDLLDSNNQIIVEGCTLISVVESDGNRRIVKGGLISLFMSNNDTSKEYKKIFSISRNTIGWGRLTQKDDGSWISLFSNGQDITEEFPVRINNKDGVLFLNDSTLESKQIDFIPKSQAILDKYKTFFDNNTGNLIVKREDGRLFSIYTGFHIASDQDFVIVAGLGSNMVAQKEDGLSCVLINHEFQIVSDEYLLLDKYLHWEFSYVFKSFEHQSKYHIYENTKIYWNGKGEIITKGGGGNSGNNGWNWYSL